MYGSLVMWPFRRTDPTKTQLRADLAQARVNIHQLKARIRALQRQNIIEVLSLFVEVLKRDEEADPRAAEDLARRAARRPASADPQAAGEPHRPGLSGSVQNPHQRGEGEEGRGGGEGDNQDGAGADSAGVPRAERRQPSGKAAPRA